MAGYVENAQHGVITNSATAGYYTVLDPPGYRVARVMKYFNMHRGGAGAANTCRLYFEDAAGARCGLENSHIIGTNSTYEFTRPIVLLAGQSVQMKIDVNNHADDQLRLYAVYADIRYPDKSEFGFLGNSGVVETSGTGVYTVVPEPGYRYRRNIPWWVFHNRDTVSQLGWAVWEGGTVDHIFHAGVLNIASGSVAEWDAPFVSYNGGGAMAYRKFVGTTTTEQVMYAPYWEEMIPEKAA